jgi:carotenoid cleavage dioxygenase-like enzyme
VYDPTRDSSDFVVLDAHDIAAKPIAVVRLPQRVPFGFHGNWVADA